MDDTIHPDRRSRQRDTRYDRRKASPSPPSARDTNTTKSRHRSRSTERHSSHRRRDRDSGKRRSRSPRRSHHSSRSHDKRRRSRSRDDAPPPSRPRAPLPSQEQSYAQHGGADDDAGAPAAPREKPNFKTSGLLAADTNKVTIGSGTNAKSIVLKYHEPPEARKPPPAQAWTMFIFNPGTKDPIDSIALSTRSVWLLGRDAHVTDLPVADDESVSGQHAVLQFRQTSKTDEFGERRTKVGLYLLDLESKAGTRLNGERVEAARYVQLLSGDVLKFGRGEREYVLVLPPK